MNFESSDAHGAHESGGGPAVQTLARNSEILAESKTPGSWEAFFRRGACIGTVNRDRSRTRTRMRTRTKSKRFDEEEKEKEEEEDYGSWEEFDKDCDKVLWEGSIKSPGEI